MRNLKLILLGILLGTTALALPPEGEAAMAVVDNPPSDVASAIERAIPYIMNCYLHCNRTELFGLNRRLLRALRSSNPEARAAAAGAIGQLIPYVSDEQRSILRTALKEALDREVANRPVDILVTRYISHAWREYEADGRGKVNLCPMEKLVLSP